MTDNFIQNIDKKLVANRFAHSRKTYGTAANVQREIAEKLMKMLMQAMQQYRTHATHIVECGCGTGYLSRLLWDSFRPKTLLLNDLCPEMKDCITDISQHSGVHFMAGDAELLIFPQQTDLIASCSTLQWFNDPANFIIHCSQALAQGGWIAFSTFGSNNMFQIKELTGKGLEYLSLDKWKELLTPDYHIITLEQEKIEQNFATPLEVLKHLKQTGVTGIEKQMWTPGYLKKFCNEYQHLFGNEEGGVSLTYHPIYIIAKIKS